VIVQSKCPICSNTNTQEVLRHEYFPYFTVPVTKEDKSVILQKYSSEQLTSPLVVNVCVECPHCYLDPLPDQSIVDYLYSNFYSYPSPLKGQFQPERDDRFLQFFEENVTPLCKERTLNRILEVGCFDGYVLFHLQKKGFNVTGCDPSEGAEIGQEHGVNILRKFFDADEFLSKEITFDVVISRHFVEHVTYPPEWIQSLKKILSPNGLLVVETPNVSFYLERGLLEVFSLQHLQGFSSESLEKIFVSEGLKSMTIEETPNNLIAIAEKGFNKITKSKGKWDQNIKDFNEKLSNNKSKIKHYLAPFIQENKTIGIWGAGGFGLAALMLYDLPSKQIRFMMDSDSKKWNMEYLNYQIPIISPQLGKEKSPDLVVIASMYSQSILKQIKAMNFQAKVLTIFPEIVLHEI